MRRYGRAAKDARAKIHEIFHVVNIVAVLEIPQFVSFFIFISFLSPCWYHPPTWDLPRSKLISIFCVTLIVSWCQDVLSLREEWVGVENGRKVQNTLIKLVSLLVREDWRANLRNHRRKFAVKLRHSQFQSSIFSHSKVKFLNFHESWDSSNFIFSLSFISRWFEFEFKCGNIWHVETFFQLFHSSLRPELKWIRKRVEKFPRCIWCSHSFCVGCTKNFHLFCQSTEQSSHLQH